MKKKKKLSVKQIVAKNKIANLAIRRNLTKPKSLMVFLVIAVLIFVFLIGKIFYLQFFTDLFILNKIILLNTFFIFYNKRNGGDSYGKTKKVQYPSYGK